MIFKLRYLFIFIFIVNGCFSFSAEKGQERTSLKGGEVFLDLISQEEWKEVNNKFHPENLTKEQVEAIRNLLINNERYNEAVFKPWNPRHDKLGTSLWNQQIKGFPVEALVFYAAIGATMWRKAYTDVSFMSGGRQDPRWLENFVHELTSPVGVFSFFCFVLASGTASHLYSKGLSRLGMGPWSGSVLRHRGINHAFSSVVEPRRSARMKYGAAYGTTGWGLRTVGTFSGQIGMAFGLMASDIVHELHTQYFHSHNAEKCANDLMKSEARMLYCNLMWDDIGQKAVQFLPGLASMLTASVLSHLLVRGVFTAVAGAGRSATTVIKSALLPRVSMVVAGKISWRMIASTAIWLVPGGGKAQVAGRAILGTAGHLGFRFLNLYAFMEMEQLLTHGVWDYLWGEGIKSNAVAKSMDDFLRHYNVNRSTPYRICFQEGEDCEYHSGILDMHLVSNRFNQWRQYKLQEALMSHHNWFLYVSNAISSFDLARDVYREFFLAKKNSTHFFNEIKYFGAVEEDENKEKEWEEKARASFSDMLKMIDKHIEENAMKEPKDLQLDVVSSSPSHFLKPIRQLNIKKRDDLFVLRALFEAQDSNFSGKKLKEFYGSEWEKASEVYEKRILDSNLNPNKLIKSYFEYLERNLVSLKKVLDDMSELMNNLRSEQELMDLVSKSKPSEELKEQLKAQSSLDYKKSIVARKWRLVLLHNYFEELKSITDEFSKQSEDSFLTEVDLTQAISSQLEKVFTRHPNEGNALKWYFTGWKSAIILVDAFASEESNVVSNEAIQKWLDERWKPIIQDMKNEFLVISLPIDKSKLEREKKDRLRKKVLAAGVEYLNHIVELEKTARKHRKDKGAFSKIGEEEKKGIEFLPKIKVVFLRLGMDNIFAKLYQLTFIKKSSGEYVQIEPKARGMSTVEHINNDFKLRTKIDEVKYHPSHLRSLRTPYVMDFLVSSVLCGPDLRGKEHTDLINLITSTVSASSLEKNFSQSSGGLMARVADVGQGMLEGKGLLFQAMETKFPGLEMNEIVDQILVFDHIVSSSGLSYDFYPPRLDIGIDENVRKAICSGSYSKTPIGTVENIYDNRFPTEVKNTPLISGLFNLSISHSSPDKEYSNLLHLVLDHIGSGEISSLEEFDEWWEDNVEPYKEIFLLAADREYKRIVEYEFMKPLFQNGMKEMTVGSRVATTGRQIYHILEQCKRKDASAWDKVSKSLFHYKSLNIRHDLSDEASFDPYCIKFYSAELPIGVFQNMYFETHYWADIILYFGKKRIKAFEEDLGSNHDLFKEMNIGNLKKNLENLIGTLKIDEKCLSTEEELEKKSQIEICLEWGKQFLSRENEEIFDTIFHKLAVSLYINDRSLLGSRYPFSEQRGGDSMQSMSAEERHKKANESFSSFEKNYDYVEENKIAALPDQFINFALLRLRHIFEETVQYVSMTGFISDSPEVKGVRGNLSN